VPEDPVFPLHQEGIYEDVISDDGCVSTALSGLW